MCTARTELRKQVEPGVAFVLRFCVIHGHLFKERVDRRAKLASASHRLGEVLGGDGAVGLRLGGVERVDQRLFGGFGGVGKA